jgi:hypothetical protein
MESSIKKSKANIVNDYRLVGQNIIIFGRHPGRVSKSSGWDGGEESGRSVALHVA